ncbi:MAG: hypothetical protein ACOCYB_08665 [Alkalispirochaeta sp.]
MGTKRTGARAVLVVMSVVSFAACSGGDEAAVELPETPALVGQESYALVTEEYVRFHEAPNLAAPVIGHRRSGDVLEALGTTANKDWTEVRTPTESGWVQTIHIRRFANRRQAVNARRLLDE